RALDLVGLDYQTLDAAVLGRGVDRGDDVAQLYFLGTVAEQARERSLGGLGGILFHNVAFRIEHESGAILQVRRASAQRRDEEHDEDHENEVHRNEPKEIERAPQSLEEASDAAGSFIVHVSLLSLRS